MIMTHRYDCESIISYIKTTVKYKTCKYIDKPMNTKVSQ